MSKENDYIQLPPLRRNTDPEVIIALWEYMKMPEESQKVVLSAMEEINNANSGEDISSPEDYRKLVSESVGYIQNIILFDLNL